VTLLGGTYEWAPAFSVTCQNSKYKLHKLQLGERVAVAVAVDAAAVAVTVVVALAVAVAAAAR